MAPVKQDQTERSRGASGAVADDTFRRSMAGLGNIVETITPWLLDLGSWIFGALIAFNLLILGAILTVGPVDPAVLVATAAIALALPLEVAGFLLLRLLADMKNVDLEEIAATAFQRAGFTYEVEDPAGRSPESVAKRRTRLVLRYSYLLLGLSLFLTLMGVTATLWHMAWWIAVLFPIMVVLSQALVLRAIAATGSDRVWRAPDGSLEPRATPSSSTKD